MTILRISFAGEIKKADTKSVGGKQLVELSICKKNRTKDGDPEAYTWLRIGLWEPALFQVPKLVKGAFIAGTGELTLRSYEGKDGKASSLECRCSSFDVEVSDGSSHDSQASRSAEQPIRRQAPMAKPTPADNDSQPPF